jgi:hypothetical protein
MLRVGSMVALLLLSLSACSQEVPRSQRQRPRARPDKAELFGDPGLVPTREGERARRELARAGEIEKALAIVPLVRRSRVDVELDEAGAVARVLVVVDAEASDDELEPTVRRIVGSVAGSDALDSAEIIVRSQPNEPTKAPPSWALLATVLALGVSLGISYERGRRVLAIRRRGALRRRPSSG